MQMHSIPKTTRKWRMWPFLRQRAVRYGAMALLAVLLLVVCSAPAGAQSLKRLRPFFEMEGDPKNDMMGFGLVALGDINGDGWPDFATNSAVRRKTLIYFGGPGILDDVPDAELEGGMNILKGDVNGDGLVDLIARKQCRCELPVLDRDTVFVYLGKAGPGLRLESTPAVRICTDSTERLQYYFLGMTIGDFNGDGYDDFTLIDEIGTYMQLYMGKPIPSAIADYTVRRDRRREYIRNAFSGDVNGDGLTDLLVATHFYWNPGDPPPPVNYHLLGIFHGKKNGWSFDVMHPDQEWNTRGFRDSSRFESSFERPSILDCNNDGIDDVILRPFTYRPRYRSYYDTLYIFYGRTDSLRTEHDRIIVNPDTNRWWMTAFDHSRIHDLNGDGFRDYLLAFADYLNDDLLLYLGNAFGITGHPAAIVSYPYDKASFGDRLMTVGDMDGDGREDVLISSWEQETAASWGYVCMIGGDTTLVTGMGETLSATVESPMIRAIWPNPARVRAMIDYFLPRSQYVRVEILNLLGRHVSTLVDGFVRAGEQFAVWNGNDASGRPADPGLYFCKITTRGTATMRKLILAR